MRDLRHPREKVWRAITEPEHLDVWFPTSIDGDRAAGAPLKFVFPFPDAPVMEGTMLAYDPPSTIEFEWRYGDDGRWKEVAPWYMEHFPKEATTAPIPDFHPDAN